MTTARYNRRELVTLAGGAMTGVLAGCLGDTNGDPQTDDDDGNTGEPDDGLPDPRTPDVDTISAHPTDLPGPVDWDEPRHHEWELHTEEYVAEIAPGVSHRFMTFDGRVPGPLFRARVGDRVTLRFEVPDELNQDVHNVDFHAVYGPGGGAVDTTLAPGDDPAEIEFRLEYPGAHIYHCAPGAHDYHIGTGMFGAIVVEPEEGLPPVDREFYLGQHELYTNGGIGERGHHAWDVTSARAEDPTYVLFNGEPGRFVDGGEAGPLHAEVGEVVRVIWCNGGPNLASGPHPIGNVWTRWYDYGDLVSAPRQFVEGAALPAGMTGIGEMEMVVPGPIHLVDHALSRVVHKGLVATIDVEGDPNPDVFDPTP